MFPTSQVGNFRLPEPSGAWEIAYMAEADELRGARLYRALIALKPDRLAETDWAVQAGVNRGFFTNLKTSNISPRSDTLRKLLRSIGKTEAELYRADEAQSKAPESPDEAEDDPIVTGFYSARTIAPSADGSVPLRQVDLALSMGDGANIDDYVEEGTLDFDANLLRTITRSPPERLFVARGAGDSMMPTLLNDDMVVIDTLQRTLNMLDRIWAVSVHGAGAIKRLRAIGRQRVLVISDNAGVENQEVDAEDLRILGRVIWVGRRM